MKNLKKLLLLIITFCLSLFISCEFKTDNKDNDIDDNEGIVDFDIYSINDFHGMVLDNDDNYVGISRIGAYLKEKKNDASLIISAGDMFQGTALSSMSRGKVVVEAMNEIGFDAMTIGNHEFDWGIEEVLKYQDGNKENGECNFPFLAANIIDKSTNKLASFAKPYEVITRKGVKFGIIGIIGCGQESDILTSYVEKYVFSDEYEAIKKYTKVLREEENCDIVILSCHCDTEEINEDIAELTGSYKVDAILNGHTHQAYYNDVSRDDAAPLPFIQTGCYGRYVGYIKLSYDKGLKKVVDSSCLNIDCNRYMKKSDNKIDAIINNYNDLISKSNEVLGKSNRYIYREEGGYWACQALYNYTKTDFAIINTGGIRGNAFPIYDDQTITYGNIFTMMPFENTIRTCKLKGSIIKQKLINSNNDGYYYFSDNVSLLNQTINGELIQDDKEYSIATIDFLFEKVSMPFTTYATEVEKYDLLFRDVLVNAVKVKGYI